MRRDLLPDRYLSANIWSMHCHGNVVINVQRTVCRDLSTDRYLSANIWSMHCHGNVVINVQRTVCRDLSTDRYLSANLGIGIDMLIGDYNATGGAS